MDERKRKLCVVIPAHWAAVMGGSQYQARMLVEALVDEYDIYYLASNVSDSYSPKNYQVVKIADRTGIRRYGYFFDAPRLTGILGDIKPDIIYQRVTCAYTGIAARYATKNGCKMVWHIAHDWDVSPFEWRLSRNLPFRLIEKKLAEYGISHADSIVAQTRRQNDLLEANYGRSADAVIPNFHPLPTEKLEKSKPVKIVWAANLKSWKRPEVFVQLARDLGKFENVEFIMIGRQFEGEPNYSNIKQTVAGIRNLRYLGALSQEGVNETLAAADIFVNTSRYEGFANTFIQSWMRKVPVVSLDVSADDALTEHQLGFFSEGSYDKLRDQVKTLIENESLRSEMGGRARDYAFTHHSVKNIDSLAAIFSA